MGLISLITARSTVHMLSCNNIPNFEFMTEQDDLFALKMAIAFTFAH